LILLVSVRHRQTKEDRLLLLRHDTDAFNRWESCQHLALDAALALVEQQATSPVPPPYYLFHWPHARKLALKASPQLLTHDTTRPTTRHDQ
jgi:hypothetical protein